MSDQNAMTRIVNGVRVPCIVVCKADKKEYRVHAVDGLEMVKSGHYEWAVVAAQKATVEAKTDSAGNALPLVSVELTAKELADLQEAAEEAAEKEAAGAPVEPAESPVRLDAPKGEDEKPSGLWVGETKAPKPAWPAQPKKGK